MMMVLAGCGGAPADTVNRFFNAVKSEKYTAAASFCALDDEERAQFSILGAKLKVALDKKQVTVGKATVAGDGKTASVQVTLQSADGEKDTQEIKLKKVDGKWRIELSSLH